VSLPPLHFQAAEFGRVAVETLAWLVAGAWCWRTSDTVRYIPTLPDLTELEWDSSPRDGATLTVVVPARDEAAKIAATLDALLLADYTALKILLVDDRSTDATGTIMDAYVRQQAIGKQPTLEVIHMKTLPAGWLGKTHAMSVATQQSHSEYVLFTDADVLFSPSVLRRAVAYAEQSRADHLVVLPTMQVMTRGEGIVLGFFQVLGIWASRLWRVSDVASSRDFVGVGAFNLVRRAAFESIGGWAPQRMAVLEDVTLGRRMKLAGMRQRVAYAPGLVLVHWASGAIGLVRVMTKNLFSSCNFRPLLMLGACGWIMVFCLAPLAALAWWPTLLPGLLVLCCIGAIYRVMGAVSRIDARYAWLYPLGAAAFVWAMLRSMMVVLWRGGVVWRGTFYALHELRRYNNPLQWGRSGRG
jgi:GT2 family glycosyltransferase